MAPSKSTSTDKTSKADSKKRLVFILGGKGGTGKTLFCRLLYHYFETQQIHFIGFDADRENPEFFQFHREKQNPVQLLDFLDIADAKKLFTAVHDESPDVVLMDMPGASGAATRDQFERFNIFAIADQLDYRITIATVLNVNFNTIKSFDVMMQYCREMADYVAVRNEMWIQGNLSFHRWETSEAKTTFDKLGGAEISMPVLDMNTFDVVHGGYHPFSDCLMDARKLYFGDILLVESFLSRSFEQIQLIEPLILHRHQSVVAA